MWLILFNFPFLLLNINYVYANKNNDIEPIKTFVWGPGLQPENITLRARYIFLQLVNKDGKNITESPGKEIIFSQISGETKNGKLCHIWTQVFDCKDGSFIIRYRVYNTCFNFKIILKVKNKILPLRNHEFKGPVYEEECYCPNPSIQSWINSNDCSQNNKQILQDLKLFNLVNFDNLRNKIISKYNKPNSFSICHYVIKSNKIYRHCYGQHIGFKIFSDSILLSLTRKTVLPDVEFFMNLGDWPLVPKQEINVPIFSWCGSEKFNDIILPSYDITQSSMEAMGKVMLDMLSIQGNTKLPWNKKVKKLFWRGRDSHRERLNLIDIAMKNPDIFNASITNFFFFKNETKKYGPPQKHISFFEFFQYKYQLNIDGTVASYRFPYLLAGDSLVFKQNSKYYEFFYSDIEPNKHFISIKSDLSDLVNKINWAKRNEFECEQITKRAREYVRNHLMPQNIICYHIILFYEWSKRLKSNVQIFPEMEAVIHPAHDCDCKTSKKGRKDEL